MNDGGLVFPEIISNKDSNGNYDTYSYGGMILRDWFAGQAVIGLLAHGSETVKSHTEIARQAYYLADAMIEKRGK
jgi:hypothetical protein